VLFVREKILERNLLRQGREMLGGE